MAYVKTNWVDNTTPIDKNNLNKIESGIKNNDINIGEENYDNTKTYEVGDIVRYNEKIYKCITAITTAENFDSSKWEQTNIVEIVQSEKSKIYELIEAISTPIVGEGEYITLNDTAEKRFENFDIEGNSEQETREGYNLLDFKETNTAITKNGLNYKKNSDGSIEVSGTPNSAWDYTMANKYTFKAGKTYTVMANVTAQNPPIFYFKFNSANGGVKNVSNGGKTTITIKEDEELNLMWSQGANSTVNFKAYILMYEGTEDKGYEQYGASPSLDYPSEVETVGSNENLLNNIAISKSMHGLDFVKNEDGTVFVNGTATSTTFYNIINDNDLPILGDGLILSGCAEGGSSSGYKLRVTYTDTSYSQEYGAGITLQSGKTILTTTIVISTGTVCDNLLFKPKIEKGTVATPYSPYGMGSVGIDVVNKNLFDKDNAIKEYELDGTTGEIMSNSLYFTSDYIRVNPNEQYYLSGKNTGNSNCFYNKDKKFISRINLENGLLTVPDDLNIYYLRFNSRLTAIDTTMLEKNTKKTEYEEHQKQSYIIPTQQPMRAIGDIRDTFIKKNNKWYERHYGAEIIIDGTETINKSSSKEFFDITKTMSNLDTSANAVNVSKSNYGTGTTLGLGEGNTNNKYSFNASTIYLDCYGSNINTVDKLKAQLAETPMKIYALLKEPLDIECTEEQSTILFDIEQNAKTYKGVTHIYSNDEVSPNCYVEAVKDLTTLIQ